MDLEKLTIGQMAELNHVSEQTLRLYDREGLMKPRYTDPVTGYRYYHITQSARLDMIQTMKVYGMTLRQIRAAGAKASVTIKPATPAEAVFDLLDEVDMVLVMSVEPGFGGQSYLPCATEKIAALRQEIDRRGLPVEIQVDGGINVKTAPLAAAAGVDILVAGSALFNAPDMSAAVSELRRAADVSASE